jgi:integrase
MWERDMAKAVRPLTALKVKNAGPGTHSDGGGLMLVVDKRGQRSWVWRYSYGGRRRDMGLGPASQVSLAEARAERDRWRAALRDGRDPHAARKAERTPVTVPTFGEMADECIKTREAGWRSAVHRRQWHVALNVHAADLRGMPVAEITTADVLRVVKLVWTRAPQTGGHLRGRIEMVLDFARAHGHIRQDTPNPARWRGHLEHLLPAVERGKVHLAAMPYADVPAFVASLRTFIPSEAATVLAIEFIVLMAVRLSEAINATRDEINLNERVWTIPAGRMKAKQTHVVPLSDRAVEIVREAMAMHDGPFMFKGLKPRRPLTGPAVLRALQRRTGSKVTIHGFRSSFRDWAGDKTEFEREIAEAALAHRVGNAVEKAYRRGSALEKRRSLMEQWARHCDGDPASNVVRLRA